MADSIEVKDGVVCWIPFSAGSLLELYLLSRRHVRKQLASLGSEI